MLKYDTVFILGAGFSKPAGFPLVANFVERLMEHRARNRGKLTNERYACFLEYMAHFRNDSGGHDLEKALTAAYRDSKDVYLLLLDGIYACLDGCAEAFPYSLEQALPYFSFLKRWKQTSSAVITFNYDTVLEKTHYYCRTGVSCFEDEISAEMERLLAESDSLVFDYMIPIPGRRYSPYPSGASGPRPPDYRPFLKLHGAMNWWWCDGHGGYSYFADDSNNTHPGVCRKCKSKVRLNLIPPSAAKDNADFEQLWKYAGALLSDCRELIIIGYSIPRIDQSTIALLKKTLARSNPPKVTIVDHASQEQLDQVRDRWRRRFAEVFEYDLRGDAVFLGGVERYLSCQEWQLCQ